MAAIVENIASLGLKSLQNEPIRLQKEAEKWNADLEALILENYRVFVDNLACSVSLRNDDKRIISVSSQTSRELKDLSSMCISFRERVQGLINAHKRNRKTLQFHIQLIELLEIPQLVDACCRNEFYDEALELANFINSLSRRNLLSSQSSGRRHASNVIHGIIREVYSTLLNLRSNLFQSLTENISLPKEIQIISTLRKLDSLFVDRQLFLEYHHEPEEKRLDMRSQLIQTAEMSLQMDFLEARSIWLERSLDSALHDSFNYSSPVLSSSIDLGSEVTGKMSSYGKAMELLEVHRSVWFAIVTQFHALFEGSNSDDRHFKKSMLRTEEMKDKHSQNIEDQDILCATTLNSHDILGLWLSHQSQRLLTNLQIILPQIEEGASLRSIMDQALGFAERMSQVGCDFTASLVIVFEDCIVDRVKRDWHRAVDQFGQIIAYEKIVVEMEDILKEQLVPIYFPFEGDDDKKSLQGLEPVPSIKGNKSKSNSSEDVAAPQKLLNFPPLAYLCNGILQGLSLVRDCPLKSLQSNLEQELRRIFVRVISIVSKYDNEIRIRGKKYGVANEKQLIFSKGSSHHEIDKKSPLERELDQVYWDELAKDLIPHILLCLNQVFESPSSPALRKWYSNMPHSIEAISDIPASLTSLSHNLTELWHQMEKAGWKHD